MNPNFTNKSRRTRGFSLIEFSIVLGVMGIVFGGIWVLASRMYHNVKHERFSEMLTTIVGNVRGFYARGSSFGTTNIAATMLDLARRNVFPGEAVHLVAGAPVVDTPFGQNTLFVCGWAASGQTVCGGATPNVPFFAIEVLLSLKDCINVVMRNSSATLQPGLIAVYSNGAQRAFPFTLTSAIAACTPTAPATINNVDFVYKLVP